jgi:hypothetical protein
MWAAIVSREEHQSVQARAQANVRSRQAVPAGQARPTAKTEYLYRGLLHCGICGLRMWGNHKRQSTYYSCQPGHQRSKNVPAEHPPSVYLNEKRLNEALFGFLTSALFGADRVGYWTRALDDAADPERVAPAGARLAEIQDELADLERRLGRQLLNLEAEETTPALRKRIAVRVAELEDTIADWQQRAANSPNRPTVKRPRWPTSPRCSTGYPSLLADSPTRHSARCARGSSRSSWRSATNRATKRSTWRSPSATTSLTK